MKPLVSLAATALLLVACDDARLTGPAGTEPGASRQAAAGQAASSRKLPPPAAHGLAVMTYNVYLGANLDPVIAAAPQDVPLAAAEAWATVQRTDFRERAGKLADQIAAAQPQLVGLQEVALWRVQSPGDAAFGGTVAATEVRYDFLQLILDSLRARGLQYVAAAADTTSDVEVPVLTGVDAGGNPTFDDVRFTDRDAILARADVTFDDPQGGRFAAFIPVSVGGVETGIYRGWCSVEATAGGGTFRFVNSHLEAESPDVAVAQAGELLRLLRRVDEPVVWVGDFNSDAITGGAAYTLVTGGGFADLWPLAHPDDPGLTNGPADGVLVPALSFDSRIDLILLRGFDRVRDVHAVLLGIQPADRTASGLWPSDHAAVAATFKSSQLERD